MKPIKQKGQYIYEEPKFEKKSPVSVRRTSNNEIPEPTRSQYNEKQIFENRMEEEPFPTVEIFYPGCKQKENLQNLPQKDPDVWDPPPPRPVLKKKGSLPPKKKSTNDPSKNQQGYPLMQKKNGILLVGETMKNLG